MENKIKQFSIKVLILYVLTNNSKTQIVFTTQQIIQTQLYDEVNPHVTPIYVVTFLGCLWKPLGSKQFTK